MIFNHKSVLLNETVDSLCVKPQGIYVDGTLGGGGHASEVAARLGDGGRLIGIDQDADAIAAASERLAPFGDKITVVRSNYERIAQVLDELEIPQVDGIYLDLGVSSFQLDTAERGFTYREDDAPLDMRMDQSQKLSAYQVVNEWEYQELVRIFFQFGEESFAKQIARKIEKAREVKPIETTFALVDVIKSALPAKVLNKKGHPAKKVFQAIRIAVNDELGELQLVLRDALELLHVGGRLCVISFQSLEDRIVKDTFASCSKPKQYDKRIPILPQDMEAAPYRLLNKKPITATEEELRENMRSHSAKLRCIERIR